MKKLINFIIILIIFSTTSCNKDFLVLYPEGQINEGNFYLTTSDFQQAVVGAYVPLRDVSLYAFYMEEMRSDNTEYDYYSKDRGGAGYEQLADFLDVSSNGVLSSVWLAEYKGIQRTNIILDRIANINSTVISDVDKNQIIGEAKALRAHYYFELVRCFGGVPLYLHEVKGNESAFINRSSVDSVYTQIITDFSDALTLLAAPAKFPQTGRMTKGTVATELGLVYLTRKDYAKATPLLQSVTQMGYALLPNYADVFKLANKNSKESIFEVQFKAGTDGQSSPFIYNFMPTTTNTTNILGVNYKNTSGGFNVPTNDMVAAYEVGDKRLDASIAVAKGKYNSSVDFIPDSVVSVLHSSTPGSVSKMFIRKYFNAQAYALVKNTDDNWPLYRYADVLLMLAESLNEEAKPAEALPFLNLVRNRAGLASATSTDQTALRSIIAHERRVELAFENHRWFDLVRTGQAISVMNAFGVQQKLKYAYLLPASYNVTQNRLIYAIPYRETQVNLGLKQNPDY